MQECHDKNAILCKNVMVDVLNNKEIIRIQKKNLIDDLQEKMVFLAGPRQVGKTYLSERIFKNSQDYLNWDDEDDRKIILNKSWDRNAELIIFDELHKRSKWKSWIKGVYDKEKNNPPILVTGSAKMNIFRKGGDSLAGRYFLHRLYPFSVSELCAGGMSEQKAIERLLLVGGFPEPFMKGTAEYAKRWRKTHIERIIMEDLLTLENVRDISNIEMLVELLSQRVGSPISFASLARDLSVSPHTIKKWISVLESLFVIFIVRPYSKNLSRSISKEPKIYFFDIGRIARDENNGARLENLVALSLLKRLHYLEDTKGENNNLHYVRDREKREVDFLTIRDGDPEFLIEVKSSDKNPTNSLKYFSEKISVIESLQLVHNIKRSQSFQKIQVTNLAGWLAKLEI